MTSHRSLALRSLRSAAIFLGALAAAGVSAARAEPPAAPPAVLAEAKRLLAELIAIDTTQAGSTAPAVELLAATLRGAGFGDEDLWIVGPRAEKLNLVVRLRGAAASRDMQNRKPILFLSHLDVVAAPREDWTVEPFQLTEQDGFLYGRGTLDIKGEVVDLVVNFARLRREGFVPARDFYLALTADEEEGDANGVAWLLAERRDLLDVAYVINTDSAGLQQQAGRLVRMPIQTSEKIYLSFELEATNPGGHSALPTRENAIYRLAAALSRLDGLEFPLALSATTRQYFERLATTEPSELAAAFRGVLADPPEPAAVEKLSSIPFYNAALRTLCTPTLLAAGHAENALPQRATATIQCRLLPDDDPGSVQKMLSARIADPQITVQPKEEPILGPESPIDPTLFATVAAVTESCWPGVPVLPVMDPWASDGALLRRAGIPAYGISGIFVDIDDVRSHGKDERIAVAAFEQGLEFMHRLMRRLGGASE
jgi:acetylornithine deacetylase/succinyl-diaminopimelate desuccinylase-like protein